MTISVRNLQYILLVIPSRLKMASEYQSKSFCVGSPEFGCPVFESQLDLSLLSTRFSKGLVSLCSELPTCEKEFRYLLVGETRQGRGSKEQVAGYDPPDSNQ